MLAQKLVPMIFLTKKLAQTDDALNGIAVAATVIMFALACLSVVVGVILLRRNDRPLIPRQPLRR